MAEGILAGREFLPLEQYFRPAQPTTAEPGERRTPPPPLKGGTAFMFDLVEPLEAIPVDIRPGVPRIESSPVTYYDYDGKYLSHGTITREVEFEGIEDVECPAGRFVACPRVRVNLALRIPWIVSMDWSSWLWLSPQVGEVRRMEHMSGLFLIFLYSSSHEYVLASYAPVGATMDCGLDVAPHWTTGAVVLSRAIPRPEIAGMVVDYDTGTTSAAVLAPADDADAMPASRE